MIEARQTHSKEVGWSFRRWIGLSVLSIAGVLLLGGCASAPAPRQALADQQGKGFDNSEILAERRAVISGAAGETRPRVVWLGVSTTVVNSELTQRFPYLNRLPGGVLGKGEASKSTFVDWDIGIQREFKKRRDENRPFPAFDLIDAQDQRKSDIGLALLLNKETWREEQLIENYRQEYSLLGQVVFIDQENQQLLSSYPISVVKVDSKDGKKTDEEIAEQVRLLVFGNDQNSFSPETLLGQFISALEKRALQVKPETCFETLSVSFDPACEIPLYRDALELTSEAIVKVKYTKDELDEWASNIGPVFSSYLCRGVLPSGDPVVMNPFISKQSGKDNILSLQFQKGASRTLSGDGSLSLKLKPATRSFALEIKSLNCEVDPKFTGKYVVNLIFGFKGKLLVRNPVEEVVFETDLDASLDGFKKLPKNLQEDYWQFTRRKMTPDLFKSGSYDSKWTWQNSLDNFLDGLTSQIFGEKYDAHGQFKLLRKNLKDIQLSSS